MNPLRTTRYTIDHHSVYEYSESAHGSVMIVYLRPREDHEQRLFAFEINIDPVAAPIACKDSFDNWSHIFNIHRNHMHTSIHTRSVVEAKDRTELPHRLGDDAWNALANNKNSVPLWDYLAPSKFIHSSKALEKFIAKHNILPGPDPLDALRQTCSILYETFTYTPNSTTANSPIDCILKTGKGVCQDYAHVMIALARNWGIPSRYVSGYLHLEGIDGEQSLKGASHAWAEFWLPEIGWTGFDPTNNTVVDHRHIRVAQGRDYADITPTRGILTGGGETKLDVSVIITEYDKEPAPNTLYREVPHQESTYLEYPPGGLFEIQSTTQQQ